MPRMSRIPNLLAALPEAYLTFEPPSKSTKTYLKKEEPAKISKKVILFN